MSNILTSTEKWPVPEAVYNAAVALVSGSETDDRLEPARIIVTEFVDAYDTPKNAAVQVIGQAAKYGISRVCLG